MAVIRRGLEAAALRRPASAQLFHHAGLRDALAVDARDLDRQWARTRPHLDGIYLSFETDRDPARVEEAFLAATLRRLRALKLELDPHNLVRDNVNIDPGREVQS